MKPCTTNAKIQILSHKPGPPRPPQNPHSPKPETQTLDPVQIHPKPQTPNPNFKPLP